jgi:peptidylprolyl isomerase
MAKVKNGDMVRVHYTGSLEDGTVFSKTSEQEPLEFTLGRGQIIPGLEEAIIGMEPDEIKTIKVNAEDAFGPRRDELMIKVDRNKLPEDLKLEIGNRLKVPREDGQTTSVKVTSISESKVTLDANHPLSGKDLIFDIKLLEINEKNH